MLLIAFKKFRCIISYRLLQERDIIVYCDLHGHSRRQNVFIYGCEQRFGSNRRLHERIFPCMLHKNAPDKVNFIKDFLFAPQFIWDDFNCNVFYVYCFLVVIRCLLFCSFHLIPASSKCRRSRRELDVWWCGIWESWTATPWR